MSYYCKINEVPCVVYECNTEADRQSCIKHGWDNKIIPIDETEVENILEGAIDGTRAYQVRDGIVCRVCESVAERFREVEQYYDCEDSPDSENLVARVLPYIVSYAAFLKETGTQCTKSNMVQYHLSHGAKFDKAEKEYGTELMNEALMILEALTKMILRLPV